MNPLAVFRDVDASCIALFPELPGSRRLRECLAYSLDKGFHVQDYDHVMFHSRPSKTKSYRAVLNSLKKLGYIVNMIQKASTDMLDKRKFTSEEFDYDKPLNQFLKPNK